MLLEGTLLYGQSGGPSSVINSSAYGVIEEARKRSNVITHIYALKHGIQGLLNEDFIKICDQSDSQIELLKHTPGSAFGSVRYKLKDWHEDETDYIRILEVFKKYNVRYFFYNGGNDSMDTCLKIDRYLKYVGYECRVIGIPKTIDNDLPFTDHTPGFGSSAKFIANTMMEIAYDANAYPQGRVNIVEIMGRNAGWLTASSAIAKHHGYGPDLIYLPEIPFSIEQFKEDIKRVYDEKKHCLVAISEGVRTKEGKFIAEATSKTDAFGHTQLGGVASNLFSIVSEMGLPCRSIEFSLLQRCAAHLSSLTDMTEAIDVGSHAVKYAVQGQSGVMVCIVRESSNPYVVRYTTCDLELVANKEKRVPRSMINEAGNHMTQEFLEYCSPLIEGENFGTYRGGVSQLAKIR